MSVHGILAKHVVMSGHVSGAADPACAEGFNIGSQENSDPILCGLGMLGQW